MQLDHAEVRKQIHGNNIVKSFVQDGLHDSKSKEELEANYSGRLAWLTKLYDHSIQEKSSVNYSIYWFFIDKWSCMSFNRCIAPLSWHLYNQERTITYASLIKKKESTDLINREKGSNRKPGNYFFYQLRRSILEKNLGDKEIHRSV